MMIEPPPSADSAVVVAGPRPSQKKKRAQHKSSSKGPAHISSNGRPPSRDHDAGPRPIPEGTGTSPILFGHSRPSPGRAVVTVLVTNTDERGFTTSTSSISDTVPGTVSTDWLDRPFAFPPRKLVAHPQHGGQPLPGHRAPMPGNGQQFRHPPPPMHPHNNLAPYPGNRAPVPFVNTAPGPAPFHHHHHHNNHGQHGFHPVQPHHPAANHPQRNPPPNRMVAPRFHPYHQALSHRVHASHAPPLDFRVVDSTPIRFDPYGKDGV